MLTPMLLLSDGSKTRWYEFGRFWDHSSDLADGDDMQRLCQRLLKTKRPVHFADKKNIPDWLFDKHHISEELIDYCGAFYADMLDDDERAKYMEFVNKTETIDSVLFRQSLINPEDHESLRDFWIDQLLTRHTI